MMKALVKKDEVKWVEPFVRAVEQHKQDPGYVKALDEVTRYLLGRSK
ncbi:hypothetical protein HYY74_05205 [Candidatus Woesearchaeota archaeon]|nr:hypothetical protein [Candidatus Woesearchaeota archaeon]